MNITVGVVIMTLSNKLYHTQFRQLLLEEESEYGDPIFFAMFAG